MGPEQNANTCHTGTSKTLAPPSPRSKSRLCPQCAKNPGLTTEIWTAFGATLCLRAGTTPASLLAGISYKPCYSLLPACPPCRKTWPQAATRSAPETSMVSQTLLGRWAYRHGQCSISRVSLFCRESLKHRPTVTFLYHKNIELREPISGVVGLGSC